MSQNSRLEKLKSLISKNPGEAFARYGLAMELRNLGRDEEAAEAFSELLRHRPDYVAAYLQHGSVLIDLGDLALARHVFQKGMKISLAAGDRHAHEELQKALGQLDD